MGSLPELEFNHKLFLDKVTILYGEQRTGKSTIIVDILYYLKPHIDQIIVISPTDRTNHTYSGHDPSQRVVPLPCIHYTITDKLLKDIWERQEALCAVYSKSNNINIIRALFSKLQLTDVEKVIEDISARKEQSCKELAEQYTDPEIIKNKMAELEEEFERLIMLVYKRYINENRAKLAAMNLNADEQFTLKYLNLNPRMVIIFDDCTDQLYKFRNHPVMQKIAYQARWNLITTLIACHTDKSLDPAFKKCAFNSFFTEDSCARAYFNRGSNDYDKEGRALAAAARKAAFTPSNKHQKLAWVREDKAFYRFTATKRDGVTFGSSYIWDYCESVQADGITFSSENRFFDRILRG